MGTHIILSYAIIVLCLLGLVAQLFRLLKVCKEFKALEQEEIDKLLKEIDDETIHNTRADHQADRAGV